MHVSALLSQHGPVAHARPNFALNSHRDLSVKRPSNKGVRARDGRDSMLFNANGRCASVTRPEMRVMAATVDYQPTI